MWSRLGLAVGTLVLISGCAAAAIDPGPPTEEAGWMDFCDWYRTGKTGRQHTTIVWRWAFEVSAVDSSMGCVTAFDVWIELAAEAREAPMFRAWRRGTTSGRGVVDVVGALDCSDPPYGHEAAYRCSLLVEAVTRFRGVLNG